MENKTIFIVAGEESGDIHGSALVKELKNINPNLRFEGIGGDKLSQEDVSLIHHNREMAVMGFTEVLRKYSQIKAVFNDCVDRIKTTNYARAILIDYPGFNLRLAKEFKNLSIPVTYYISPQLWAWKESRIKIMRDCVDQILCIFPFEEEWYKARGVKATFVGHPFIDRIYPDIKRETYLNHFGIESDKIVVGLFPGSRQQEVGKHLQIMLDSLYLLQEEGLDVVGIVGKAPGVNINLSENDTLFVERNDPQSVLRFSNLAIVASGTISLEAALFGIPTVVIYRMSCFSWWIAKKLSKVKFASMTNLIAGKEVFPELLQKNATPNMIKDKLKKFITSQTDRDRIVKEMEEVRNRLGSPGAIKKAAYLINTKIK